MSPLHGMRIEKDMQVFRAASLPGCGVLPSLNNCPRVGGQGAVMSVEAWQVQDGTTGQRCLSIARSYVHMCVWIMDTVRKNHVSN